MNGSDEVVIAAEIENVNFASPGPVGLALLVISWSYYSPCVSVCHCFVMEYDDV